MNLWIKGKKCIFQKYFSMRITVLLSFLVVYGRTSYGQVSQTYNDYYLSYSHNSPELIVSHSIRRENVYRFTTDGHKITDSTLAVSYYYDDKGRIAEEDIFNSKGNVIEITEFEY